MRIKIHIRDDATNEWKSTELNLDGKITTTEVANWDDGRVEIYGKIETKKKE